MSSTASIRRDAAPRAGARPWIAPFIAVLVATSCSETPSDPGDPTPPTPVSHQLAVVVEGAGVGRVTSAPAGIDCRSGGAGTCQASYQAGTQVTLTASPDEGSVFGGWAGDGAGESQRTVSMDGARSVTAAFAERRTVFHVPGDHATVQAALDAAEDGFEVVVAPGTYEGTVDFHGKAVTLRSTDPEDPDVVAATILDGGGEGPVITIAGGAGAAVLGLTIRNGRAERGAGMLVVGTYPLIAHNVFEGNVATGDGGGLAILNAPPATVLGYNGSDGRGPGIVANIFRDNRADGNGGGFYASGSPGLRLDRSRWTDNQAGGDGGGAAFRPDPAASEAELANAFLDIIEGRFEGNEAAGDGGGLHVDGAGEMSIVTSLFAGNTAGGNGGGARIDQVRRDQMSSFLFHLLVTVLENGAGGSGGGLSIASSPDADRDRAEGDRFEVHVAGSFEGNTAEEDGGAVHVQGPVDARLEIDARDNRAGRYGGAVRATPNPDATIAELAAASLRVRGGEYTGNEAGWSGGALHLHRQTRVEVDGTRLDRNFAPWDGGGLWTSMGRNTESIDLTDVRGSINEAGARGGGFFLSDMRAQPVPFMRPYVFTARDNVWEGNRAGEGGHTGFFDMRESLSDELEDRPNELIRIHMSGGSVADGAGPEQSSIEVAGATGIFVDEAGRPALPDALMKFVTNGLIITPPYVRWARVYGPDAESWLEPGYLFLIRRHGVYEGPHCTEAQPMLPHVHAVNTAAGIDVLNLISREISVAHETEEEAAGCGFGIVYGGRYGREPL